MAEALAIMGGIGALLDLAKYGTRLVKTLEDFTHQVGSALEDVERFASQVQSFSTIIGLAQASLFQHCTKYQDSPVIAYISAKDVLVDLSRESEHVRRRLVNVKYRVKSMKKDVKFVAIFRWMVNKSSIVEILPQMESVKSSILVIMATVQLETTRLSLQKTPPGSTEEIKALERVIANLKTVIETHLETIDRLKHADDLSSSPSFGLSDHEALFNLGRNMVQNEMVPDTTTSRSLSITATAPQGRRQRRGSLYEERRMVSDTAQRFERNSRTQLSPTSTATTGSDSRGSSETDSRPTTLSTVPATTSKEMARQRQTNKILHIHLNSEASRDHLVRVEQLKTKMHGETWGNLTARCDEHLDGNVISIAAAKRLELEITPHLHTGTEDKTLIRLGGGQALPAMGRVELQLWDATGRHPRPTVSCEVCNSFKDFLVLGKPSSWLWGLPDSRGH